MHGATHQGLPGPFGPRGPLFRLGGGSNVAIVIGSSIVNNLMVDAISVNNLIASNNTQWKC